MESVASLGVIHASDPRGMKRQSMLFNFTLSVSSPEAAEVVPVCNRRDRRKLQDKLTLPVVLSKETLLLAYDCCFC